MTAVTHQMIALIAAFGLLIVYPQAGGVVLAITAIVAVMAGALTPDLDQPAANLGNRLLGARLVSRIFSQFSGGHRHFTHSVLGVLLIGYGLKWLMARLLAPDLWPDALLVWASFMAGYISHIAADTMTDRGVPWLWPLPWHFQVPPGPKAVRITTGSLVERIMLRGALLALLAVMLKANWQVLLDLFR